MSPEWTALPAGFAIATLATLVGFGGGILWMPYLILVLGLNPAQAVVTSLVIQIGGMGSGSIAVARTKRADIRLAIILSSAAILGVPVGVLASQFFSADLMIFCLGIMSMALALVFVYTNENTVSVQKTEFPIRSLIPYCGFSALFSVLTGLLSMGVGDFLVPLLRNRLNLKMEIAMGTCLIVMTINAAVAATLHVWMGESFSKTIVLWAIPGVVLGGQIGPRLAGKVSDQTLKEMFIYALSLAGIHLMFSMPGSH